MKTIKKFIPLILTVMALVSCQTTLTSSQTSSSFTTSTTTSESTTSMEDFSIVTSDNGLSASDESFTFANTKEGDLYPPEATIRLMTDNSWDFCTALLDRETKITIQDESVLPSDSVSLDIVKNIDIFGSSSNNDIYAIDVNIDRNKVNPGQSRLKIQVHPSNGSSSISKNTIICVDVIIKQFGTIEVDTYNLNLNLDLTNLDSIIDSNFSNIDFINFYLVDDAPIEEIYGYSADSQVEAPIEINDTYSQIKMENVKFAVGHIYSAYVFVQGENTTDRIWITIEPKEVNSAYSFTVNSERGISLVEIYQDNLTIDCQLSDYYTL